mmetsp:Transcript_1536/g.3279  ORF Transcript_1536/g.3279 Transcript_1536/m.3279 type:complete len:156 (-) Transcript_1536:558-1025(-)
MVEHVFLNDLPQALNQNYPVATLILDPSGRAGIFFKYKGVCLNSNSEADRADSHVWERVKFAITGGSTLVFLLSEEHSLQSFFNERTFLPETLVVTELTEEKLSIYNDSSESFEYIRVNEAFRVVAYVRSGTVPSWAVELIAAGRLRPVLITVNE